MLIAAGETALVSLRIGKRSLVFSYRIRGKNSELIIWVCVTDKCGKCKGKRKTNWHHEVLSTTDHICVPELNVIEFNVMLTVHLGTIFVNNQLDAKLFFMYVYFYSLYVSGSHAPIIKRINCANTKSGICNSVWMTANFVQLCTSQVNRRTILYENHIYPVMVVLRKDRKETTYQYLLTLV
jgi:hypothetical protein